MAFNAGKFFVILAAIAAVVLIAGFVVVQLQDRGII